MKGPLSEADKAALKAVYRAQGLTADIDPHLRLIGQPWSFCGRLWTVEEITLDPDGKLTHVGIIRDGDEDTFREVPV